MDKARAQVAALLGAAPDEIMCAFGASPSPHPYPFPPPALHANFGETPSAHVRSRDAESLCARAAARHAHPCPRIRTRRACARAAPCRLAPQPPRAAALCISICFTISLLGVSAACLRSRLRACVSAAPLALLLC